jgi:hypothetical protein
MIGWLSWAAYQGDADFLDIHNPLRYNSGYPAQGPVAQLGARFNRTEEVGGSNPPRSTGSSGRHGLAFMIYWSLPIPGAHSAVGSASQWH